MNDVELPACPCGMAKSRMAALDVPEFVTVALEPAGSVVTVPTVIVAAFPSAPLVPFVPAAPVAPVAPRGMAKLSTTALEVPELVTAALVPAAPVEVDPIVIVAAAPAIPVAGNAIGLAPLKETVTWEGVAQRTVLPTPGLSQVLVEFVVNDNELPVDCAYRGVTKINNKMMKVAAKRFMPFLLIDFSLLLNAKRQFLATELSPAPQT